MKKLLSTLLCLAALICALTLPAVAATPALSLVCSPEYAAGETFTVNVSAPGLTDCCSVAFRMTYDPALVEVTSITSADALAGWNLVQNPEYNDNELYVSLTGSEAKDLSGTVAHITFTAKSTASGSTAFSLTSSSAVGSNSAPIVLNGSSRSITITPMEQALLTVTPAPGDNGELLLHADLSQASYYCGLTFILSYDSSRYTVSKAERGSEFNSAMGYLNTSYAPGKVFISTVFSNPSTLNGRLATITLIPIDGATDAEDVSVEITDYAGSSFTPLDIDWAYNPGAITSMKESGNTLSLTANLTNPASQAQKCTVVAAYYSSLGKMLGVTTSTQTISAGGCSSYALSLARNSNAAYTRVFFLGSSGCPIAPAQQRTLFT